MTESDHVTRDKASFGIIEFTSATDVRGTLSVADTAAKQLPFDIKRVFWIYNVGKGQSRGGHAHRTCAEIVIAVRGQFTAHVTDGGHTADFVMNDPAKGLYIPAMAWCSFSDFSEGCVCLCLASHAYDPTGYINSYEEYIKAIKA